MQVSVNSNTVEIESECPVFFLPEDFPSRHAVSVPITDTGVGADIVDFDIVDTLIRQISVKEIIGRDDSDRFHFVPRVISP